jgi:toxin CcdB
MQFSIYINPDKDTKKTYPYFIDVQSNLLDSLNSRVVIPLTPIENTNKNYPTNLCPTIKIKNKEYALLTHQLTSVPQSILKKPIGSAESSRNNIVSAIDFVVTGI